MENRIAIFSKLVRDFMRDVPLAVPMGTSLADIARRREAEQASSATVTDPKGGRGLGFRCRPPRYGLSSAPFSLRRRRWPAISIPTS